MQVKKIVEQAILDTLTPEQEQAVLESITATVKEAKAVRERVVESSADIVFAGLKQIEAKLVAKIDQEVAKIKQPRDGIDGIQGPKGEKGDKGIDGAQGRDGQAGKDGKDGRDGLDGVSVIDARVDFDGSLTIVLSNGREINAGEVVSPDTAQKINQITQRPAGTGSTSQEVLDTLAVLQAEIAAISLPDQAGNAGKFLTTNGSTLSWGSVTGTIVYQGTWNASTNSPTLTSSVGTSGYYYVVSTAGSTNLNGVTDWQVGDWVIFNGSVWQKLDQTNLVISVNGQTGAVSLSTTDVAEGTNQYFTTSRARGAVSAGTGISYSSTTGVITNSAPDQTVALTGSGTTSISGTYPSFTISSSDAYVGTVTSVAALTLGTTGTDVSSTVATGTTTPVITLNIPTASATNRGALSSTDWSTFNGKQAALTSGTNIKTVNGTSLLGSGDLGTIGIAYGGTNATSFTAPSGNVKGLVFYDGTKLATDATVTDVGYDTTTNTLTANNFSASGSATAGSFKTTNFTIIESGGSLLIKYGATTIASISSTGLITSAVNIVSNGTP